MSSKLIAYDLKENSNNKHNKIDEIIKENFTTRHKCLSATWIVVSSFSCQDISSLLEPFFEKEDKFLVTELADGENSAIWYGFNEKQSDWLNIVFQIPV
jgi:hypothetical protein